MASLRVVHGGIEEINNMNPHFVLKDLDNGIGRSTVKPVDMHKFREDLADLAQFMAEKVSRPIYRLAEDGTFLYRDVVWYLRFTGTSAEWHDDVIYFCDVLSNALEECDEGGGDLVLLVANEEQDILNHLKVHLEDI